MAPARIAYTEVVLEPSEPVAKIAANVADTPDIASKPNKINVLIVS